MRVSACFTPNWIDNKTCIIGIFCNMFACHILNDQNVSDVFDQYYDDNDIPCIDSKYYDLDEFESLYMLPTILTDQNIVIFM